MKIVITGALGHIGSYLLRELPSLYPGSDIVLLDNLSSQRYASLFELPAEARFSFFETDVLKEDFQQYCQGANIILHLAAITNAAASFTNKDEVEHNNFNATKNVANFCSDQEIPLLHLSSTSVYGTSNETVAEDCSEEELNPQSPYAETKLKEEKYLAELATEKALNYTILRFGTIAGVSKGMRFHTAVNKFCWQAVTNQPITVWRTALHQKRPYLSLMDACSAIDFIINKGLFDGQIYNVVTENLTVNNILDLIRIHIPEIQIDYVDTEIMNQLSYEVSAQKLSDHGFSSSGDIESCIAETIELLGGIRNR